MPKKECFTGEIKRLLWDHDRTVIPAPQGPGEVCQEPSQSIMIAPRSAANCISGRGASTDQSRAQFLTADIAHHLLLPAVAGHKRTRRFFITHFLAYPKNVRQKTRWLKIQKEYKNT